jgi:hypothetical protein
MSYEDIKDFIVTNAITYNSVEVIFKNGTSIFGYFLSPFENEIFFQGKNFWLFVENRNNAMFLSSKRDKQFTTIINGDEIQEIKLL